MYGKLHDETFEDRMYFQELFSNFSHKYALGMEANNELMQIRSQVIAFLKSSAGTKKIKEKYGVSISPHAKPISFTKYMEKRIRSLHKKYISCEICGERRISNFCHIIPREYGGPDVEENYLYLCPTHHHLFDHNRLSKDEWKRINFEDKMESAKEYVYKIRLPLQQQFWGVKN